MQPVIFDMDGVIVDSEPLNRRHIQLFLQKIGVPPGQEVKTNLKGLNARESWRRLMQEFQLDHNIEELIQQGRKSYLEFLASITKLPEIPGAAELIQYLHRAGHPLALASSANPRRVDFFLEQLGLRKYFAAIVASDDVQRSKPAPDIFLLAAKRLAAKPADCIVIEDAANGVAAAKAAGMRCIAYAGSDHNTDDLSGADLIVKDFTAFTKSLQHEGFSFKKAA
jgi:HAD superfamily hydrolase (TIGR01509 family)